MNAGAIISRYYYNKNDDDKKQNERDYRGGLCDMSNNRYAVYAKRRGKKNWSDWCKAPKLETAMKHCENIRRLGFKAKIYNISSKKVILEDD